MNNKGLYQKWGKRTLDICLSAIALILLSPVLLFVALLVKFKLGSPVIFKQERPGKDEVIFSMYKFRTMTDEKDESGNYLPDDVRLTKFGQLLRATSLDELPELWNILKGDMSFVGPRPLLVEYLPLYNEEQRKRHSVRPGLTGLAQVKGRNAISWDEKFEYDCYYVQNCTFKKDILIFFSTIKKVIRHEGISSNSSVTIEKFEGNDIN
ncbi:MULTISPECIES: sugar transferase [Enterococcus]|uniref:Bacterial sugar transferase domain-containing protein n=1 Tax=Candidatus Enterococcus mangumiae TaxID=2230878 RepID=A0ABZ2T4X6_9ENTE|nr:MULTISPECIES: sugar transferase [unclassified Enterococcus]MBO0490427.1 sugar transferase [Enterococcus sp. DIV1094]MBO1299543.1 sugar transferase [Enterococcus sp. DIV1271a]